MSQSKSNPLALSAQELPLPPLPHHQLQHMYNIHDYSIDNNGKNKRSPTCTSSRVQTPLYKLSRRCEHPPNTQSPLKLCISGRHAQQQLHEQQHMQECFLTCKMQVSTPAAVELESARLTILSTWRHPPCDYSTFSPAIICATVVAECQSIGADLTLCREVE